MTTILKAACAQLNSGPDIDENIKAATALIRQAAAQGAQFIATPENSCHMIFPATRKLETSAPEDQHAMLAAFSDLAQELGVWLLAGSVSVQADESRFANRSVLFDNQGRLAARYDKIHLFDVDLPSGESHRESDITRPGAGAVLTETPWGKLGMTICYDLRFAHLYRQLAQKGAKILTIPAAFTVPTGQAHWETLLRARAIETGSFVLAPAQGGVHDGGRRTFGHSMIIGPWGEKLAHLDHDDTGVILADLDLSAVEAARNAIPALRHDRDFSL